MPKIDDDEVQLFRETVGEIQRLECDRLPLARPRSQSRRTTAQPPPGVPAPPPLHDPLEGQGGDPDNVLFFARPGLQNNVLRRLRQGKYSVGGELDLHGLTRQEARQVLWDFLIRMDHAGVRCVRIIHGKGTRSSSGRGVLKSHVNAWLRQIDRVLAFCSARRKDGGTGAVYVLLKR